MRLFPWVGFSISVDGTITLRMNVYTYLKRFFQSAGIAQELHAPPWLYIFSFSVPITLFLGALEWELGPNLVTWKKKSPSMFDLITTTPLGRSK